MRLIVWADRGKAPEWSTPCPECGHGTLQSYEAGELVSFKGDEYVCVNTHKRSIFPPPTSNLWARVLR
jgi:hypothetical protein